MTLSTGDMFALMIALLSVNMVLLIAFRRVYVLERRLTGYKRELRLHQDPKIWND